jgi:hypothetical protein
VFCDGPRSDIDAAAVQAVQREALEPRRFRDLAIVATGHNAGLARSVVKGVSTMLESSEEVIVLEDDLVTAPGFLTYMNDGLQKLRDDERVISIHGYSYPTGITTPFFLRGADCWGWATWRRGWALYEPDGEKLLAELHRRELTELFDFGGTQAFVSMLEDQIAGRVDSWAIRWYASAFLAGKLTLYPGQSLVQNIGHDGSGTHTGMSHRFDAALAPAAPVLDGLVIDESPAARRAFEVFFSGDQVAPKPGTGRMRGRLQGMITELRRRSGRR